MSDEHQPSNLEAEKSVLGAILIDNATLDVVMGTVDEKAFFRRAHQQIFAAMVELHAQGSPIDFTLLKARLQQKGALDDVGGPAYLSALVDGLPHSSNVEYYAKLVREKSAMRQLVQIGARLQKAAYVGEQAALEIIAEADTALTQIAGGHVAGDLVPASTLMHALFPVIEQAYENKRAIRGLQTMWRSLDELTLGLHPGTLIYLAGQTSQGKSSLGLNLAVDVARQGQTVAVFSLEDSKDQIALRALAAESNVSLYRIRSGFIADRDWPFISHAISSLGASPLFVDDTPRLTVQELRAKCRRLQATNNLALVVVDYVQMMHAPGKHENRTREVGVISAGLKQVAKELHVPLVACAQLNRETAKETRRPRLSDLRESGSLEMDADLVWLIYRPESHDPNAEEGLTELIVAKQRQGPTGTVKLRFLKETFRFVTWQDRETPQQREFSV